MEEITKEEFEILTGRSPEQDDLQRANCKLTGKPGYHQCGVCTKHEAPRFICGCLLEREV